MRQADPLLLAQIISLLAKTNSIYYLHPSFGYYFELFYPEPHGLVYKLNSYPTNALFAPPLGKEVIAENEAFWAGAREQALHPLQAVVMPPSSERQLGLWDRLAQRAHLTREPNLDATTLAGFYSRALDYWGVEEQKSGGLTNATHYFKRAWDLNPDNLVAQVNLGCNSNLLAGLKSSVAVSKSIEDEFGKYRNWDEVVSANGPFDEPNFCYEEGRTLVGNSLYRQAAAQFERAKALAPENVVARLWLAQLCVLSQKPGEALKLVEEIRAQPNLLHAARTNRSELLFVETSAHLAQRDFGGAESAVAGYPSAASRGRELAGHRDAGVYEVWVFFQCAHHH